MGILDGILGPVVSIGSAIAGNMFAEEQQTDSQQFNTEEAAKTRTFNAEQADLQRKFTAAMRQTAWQDTVRDMTTAGLNPMLSIAGHGANQAGPGAAASASNASAGIAAPSDRSGMIQSLQTASQIEVNEALAERTRAEKGRVEAETREITERTPTHAVTREQMQQQIRESIEKTKLLIQETSTSSFSAAHLDQQAKNLRELIPQIRATVDNLKAHTRLAGAQTGKAESEIKEIDQRVAANLPALQAALGNLERVAKDLAMPQRQQDASVHDSFLGSLSAVIRSLTGLGSLAK